MARALLTFQTETISSLSNHYLFPPPLPPLPGPWNLWSASYLCDLASSELLINVKSCGICPCMLGRRHPYCIGSERVKKCGRSKQVSRALSAGSLTRELRVCCWVSHLVNGNCSKYKPRDGTSNFSRVSLPREMTFAKHILKLHLFPVLQETVLGVMLHEGRTGFPFQPQPRELWFVLSCGCSSPSPDTDFWQPP